MLKKIYLSLLMCILAAGLLTSCKTNLNPLTSQNIKAEPRPLELVAEKVPVTINATFPQKWFNKKLTLVVTPILRYDGGEVSGDSYTFQGENVAGNGQVISQKNGGNVTLKSSFDYIPAMHNSQLYLTFKATVGKKSVALPEVHIADGILSTAAMLNANSENPAIAPDKFQRIIQEAHDANILFLIQQAELRAGELKKADVAEWKAIVAQADAAANKQVNVEISAYASPDGGYKLNDKLAEQREGITKKYLAGELKKAKVDVPVNARYTAQDWEGFKTLVEKSNIQDKELILRVLSMYSDSEQREREIKNISAVYSNLASEILPQLRRSRLTANVEIIGKSDEEITALAKTNPASLNVEELLYAATLSQTDEAQKAIYQKVTEIYPSDPRGYNNLGVKEYQKGNVARAESLFSQANKLASNLPEANLNLGWVALTKEDATTAEQYFGKAAGVPELNSALGYLAVQKGNYAQAVQLFGNTISNNAALAQILNKDYNAANKTLNAVINPTTHTYYLKAVVAARTNDLTAVTNNLKASIKLNPAVTAYALGDLEFAKYTSSKLFLNALTQ